MLLLLLRALRQCQQQLGWETDGQRTVIYYEISQGTRRTLKLAAEQDIYSAEHLDGLGDGGATLTHGAAIAAYASYPILPALPVSPIALALVDELPELGTPVLVLYLMWREASHDVVSVRQQQPDEPDGERR